MNDYPTNMLSASETKLELERQDAIDAVEWYRRRYGVDDSTADEMIAAIRAVSSRKQLEAFLQVIDGWLDDGLDEDDGEI